MIFSECLRVANSVSVMDAEKIWSAVNFWKRASGFVGTVRPSGARKLSRLGLIDKGILTNGKR